MHAIQITPNLLFEYQCTSGKFIRLPNRIEEIDSVARIESKLFCPNWNALQYTAKLLSKLRYFVLPFSFLWLAYCKLC